MENKMSINTDTKAKTSSLPRWEFEFESTESIFTNCVQNFPDHARSQINVLKASLEHTYMSLQDLSSECAKPDTASILKMLITRSLKDILSLH